MSTHLHKKSLFRAQSEWRVITLRSASILGERDTRKYKAAQKFLSNGCKAARKLRHSSPFYT